MINKIPMIQYQQWYRKHGIRMLSQLTAPPTTPYMELALPKNSVFHWFGYGYNDQVGLNQDDQIAKNVERLIYASNIENYQQQDVVGNPRNLPIITTSMTREYFHQNKKIRMLKGNISDINDDKCLIVFNYGLLNDHYRYTGSVTNELDRWLNYNRTIYNNIARVAKTSNRQHFVEIEVPTVIPPLTYLLAAEDGLSKDNIRKLTTASDWQVSEFFNLIATSYKAYVFKDIFNDKETLNKINIILTANGYFAVINLGLLHSFTEDSSGDSKSQLKLKIAKRFLSSLINLRGGNTDLTTSVANSDARDRLINDFNTIKEDEEEQTNKAQSVINVKEDNDVSSSRISDDPFSQFKEPVAAPVVDTTINDDKEINDDSDDIDSLVDKQLQALENVEVLDDDQNTAYKPYTAPILTPQEKIKEKAIEFQKAGILTPGEVAGIAKRAEKINTLADPRGSSKPFVESVKISKEELSIDNKVAIAPATIKGVTDKSMLYSSISKMDEQYINHTLNKDIGQMVLSLQKAGIVVLDYNVERKKDITSDFEIHKIKVQPVGGGESTVSFKIPKVNSDGTFTINNVKSRMRKQRVDIPIRKVGPDEVSLTSYYSKLFVTRTPRKRFNYSFWITNEIVACGIDTNATNIVNVKLNNIFSQAHVTPRAYSAISMRIASFESNGYTFYFDVTKLKENFGIEYDKKAKFIAVAKNNKGNILYLDFYNQLFDGKNIIGRIEEFIGLDVNKIPKEFAEFSLFGKEIPIFFILAYQLGLGNLLKTLNVNYKLVGKREQIDLENTYDSLTFNDVKFVYETSNPQANLIINGLRRLASPNIRFNFYDFDKKHVYNDVLDKLGIPLRYLKEIPLMFDLWVDHITKEILEEMKEPTDLVLLLLRAVELLTNDEFPEVNDTTYMRDRGYERVSGIIFSEMVTAMRKYRAKPVNKKNVFELHPDAVWYSILQDQSVVITEESNPIHACKEQEIVVYRGAGGRSSLTMTAKDRKFHKNSIGVTSEATVDNSETGTVVYTSYNPNYTSVRGLSKPVDISKGVENPAQILSTTGMLNPSAENEDSKRAVFSSVQNSATTFTIGYTPLPTRTGAERLIAGRSGPMFAVTAKDECSVTKLTKEAITVKYKDGREESFQLGRRFGIATAKEIPHEIVTQWKVGDKIKNGQTIIYNEHFFQPDTLNKGFTIFKMAQLARVALIESADVYEDASAMSSKFAGNMGTRVSHIRDIIVERNQGISNLVSIGDDVEPDTILCTIHNEQSQSTLFDEETLASLNILGALNPKAKYKGKVEKIEVLYVPQIETMSESLQEIVDEADRRLYKLQQALGEPRITGIVPAGFRIKGSVLTNDSIAIRVYITEDVNMAVGDKLVVANQLKATVARVWDEPVLSEDGQEVDVFFSYQSVDNRIVNSPEINGTTNTLLVELGKLALQAYNS